MGTFLEEGGGTLICIQMAFQTLLTRLTEHSREASQTVADVAVDPVHTSCTVQTRAGRALVDICKINVFILNSSLNTYYMQTKQNCSIKGLSKACHRPQWPMVRADKPPTVQTHSGTITHRNKRVH